MKTKEIVLQKGESIKFLDYTIKNSSNDDGLVLMKNKGKLYETHLGNYGTGTQENIDSCKLYALLYYMIARPETFATTLSYKIRRPDGGTMHEYYLLKSSLKEAGIEMPKEITCGDGMNAMIYFNGKPLSHKWKE